MRDDTRLIEKEDWRKAGGLFVNTGTTNSAFATRNYSVKCNARYLITVIKRYHIWWCSAHHQPFNHCTIDRAENKEK